MWIYILGTMLIVITMYLVIQAIRCHNAVKESRKTLTTYQAESVSLSYGNLTYVDKGVGEVILSVHGLFGGYDQAFDTCKDLSSDYRIIAPSRFGYIGSDILGSGTPGEQATAFVELLDRLEIEKVFLLGTSAGGSVSIRFALDYPHRTKGLILYCSGMPFQKNPINILNMQALLRSCATISQCMLSAHFLNRLWGCIHLL